MNFWAMQLDRKGLFKTLWRSNMESGITTIASQNSYGEYYRVNDYSIFSEL